jgi:hypothetical protein
VKGVTLVSKPGYLVCPVCEADHLRSSGTGLMRCESCGGHLNAAMLEALRWISALPEALGNHACECGHPEMRLLPDGTRHCPACGCEVLPLVASEGRA